MKRGVLILTIISLFQFGNNLSAQVQGKWHGKMKINETSSLTLAFEIAALESGGYSAVLHSVDQKAYNIEVDTVSSNGENLTLLVKALRSEYNGIKTSENEMEGFMSFPGGVKMELNLTRVEEFPFYIAKRPQEPKEPYPYISENVTFENPAAGIKLKGTLTLPAREGSYPAVVLISGSGPSDRNQTIFGHKTFLVLSDFLTRAGFAVLRYDDRGAGESEGSFARATIKDHAEDASFAVEFLKKSPFIKADKVGILGHSLGGDIAPVTASINPDISFVILMAGSALPLSEVIIEQCEAIYPTIGISDVATNLNSEILRKIYSVIKVEEDIKDAKSKAAIAIEEFNTRSAGLSEEERKKLGYSTPLNINSWDDLFIPYMKYDLFHDNSEYFSKVNCPVLVIGGDKDLQVLSHHVNLIKDGLEKGGNRKVTSKLYPGKNHLMQDATTGKPSEYGDIEITIAPDVVADIVNWLKKL
jgi:pimeloyl-ACP methyl ester carboxylesterase